MQRASRVTARVDGIVESRRLAASLGAEVRAARERRRLTQAALGRRVGLSQSRVSAIERGLGVGVPFEVWVGLGIALGRPLSVAFSRPTDSAETLTDAGHLEIQEYLLEIGRRNGRHGWFEQPSRPSDPSHSIDVFDIDPANACLLILEAWNRFGDLGAAARSSDRKVAETAERARRANGPARVCLCWVVRDTAANRAIVRRCPQVLASRFRATSSRWVAALENGAQPPSEPGIVWFDPSRRRLRAMRLGG